MPATADSLIVRRVNRADTLARRAFRGSAPSSNNRFRLFCDAAAAAVCAAPDSKPAVGQGPQVQDFVADPNTAPAARIVLAVGGIRENSEGKVLDGKLGVTVGRLDPAIEVGAVGIVHTAGRVGAHVVAVGKRLSRPIQQSA